MALTVKQLQAAALIGVGRSHAEVAKEVNVAESTLRRWLHDGAFKDEVRTEMHERLVQAGAKALDVLISQLDSSNPYVAQNSARFLMEKYEQAKHDGEDKDMVIRIEGMPELGVPDGTIGQGTRQN